MWKAVYARDSPRIQHLVTRHSSNPRSAFVLHRPLPLRRRIHLLLLKVHYTDVNAFLLVIYYDTDQYVMHRLRPIYGTFLRPTCPINTILNGAYGPLIYNVCYYGLTERIHNIIYNSIMFKCYWLYIYYTIWLSFITFIHITCIRYIDLCAYIYVYVGKHMEIYFYKRAIIKACDI